MIEWLRERVRRYREWVGSAAVGIVAWLLAALFIFLFVVALHRSAQAGEWFTGGSAYLIVERPWADPGVCKYKMSDMTSNLGAEWIIWEGGTRRMGVEWQVRATHHSCAFGADGPEYNAIGTGLVLRFRR